MHIFKSVWSRALLSLYFSVTVMLSSLAVGGAFSGAVDGTPGVSATVAAGTILTAVHFIVYLVMLNTDRPRLFPVCFAGGGLFIAACVLVMGLVAHPDLIRSAFHAAAALILVFMFKRDRLPFISHTRESAKISFAFLILLEAAGLVWVMIHGYHGIILATPTTQKWIGFNLYTVGYLFLGLVAILYTRSLMYLRVRVSRDALTVDERDCSSLLGESDLVVLSLLAGSKDRRITCGRISALQAAGKSGRAPAACAVCLAERNKATLCADYRRIYNQVLKIKKVLETLGLGTILQPENKMNVTREGWKLELFQNVSLHYRD